MTEIVISTVRYAELQSNSEPVLYDEFNISVGDVKTKLEHGRKPLSDWAMGIFFIILVSLIWAGSSVIVQYVLGASEFDSPLAFTYICNAMFAIYLPIFLILGKFNFVKTPPWSGFHTESERNVKEVDKVYDMQEHLSTDSCSSYLSVEKPQRILSHWAMAKASLMILPVWFVANYCYNASLIRTSVTSNTVISCTSSLWTLLVSTLYSKEKLTLKKGLGVCLAVLGGFLVGLADNDSNSDTNQNSVLGDVLALISAIMYGIYSTLLVAYFPVDNEVSMPLVFGYLGLMSAIFFAPFLLVSHNPFAGLDNRALFIIISNGLFDNVIADMLWARSVVLTTPTVAAVGLALTVPFAFLTDFLFHSMIPNILQIFGAIMVLSGFATISKSEKTATE